MFMPGFMSAVRKNLILALPAIPDSTGYCHLLTIVELLSKKLEVIIIFSQGAMNVLIRFFTYAHFKADFLMIQFIIK